jgi:DNA-binding NarL/FixJ family response regulator
LFSLLICDDHPPIRTALRLLARQATPASEVTETGTAQELLAVLGTGRNFDLLTLDLRLPDRYGLSVLVDVKQLRPALPVMVLSADESAESVTAALDAGASSYLSKSAHEDVLFQALRDAAQRRISLPSAYAGRPADSTSEPAQNPVGLSQRQAQVLDCLLRGMTAKQIGRTLGIGEGTVKSHTVAVFRALQVSTRTQAVVEAHRRGIRLDA